MNTLERPAVRLGEAVRKDFPILETDARGRKLVYLDNAATSQKPQSVLDAVDSYWTEANANVHRGVHFLSQRATERFEGSRETIRRFLNASDVREVILTKGCTEAINLVATCLQRHAAGISSKSTVGSGEAGSLPVLGKGDVILLSTMEHHSNIVPWQILAQMTGAVVKPIPITDSGEIDLDAYRLLLRENPVKVVGAVHISNSLGTVNPIREMARLAHEKGALIVVDGAQAGPHWLVDVRDLDVDFYSLSCHKIYAPTGVGVLYGRGELLEAMPPYHGGGDMVRTVSFEETTYADLPSKFEAGTPNMAGVIGLGAAINYLENLGSRSSDLETAGERSALETAMAAIHAHELDLARHAEGLLSEIPGVRLVGTAKEKAGIVGFVMDGVHPHDIGTILDNEGIAVRAGHHCCMPVMKRFGVPATARASFTLYNTREEVQALAAGVRKVREMFS